VGAAFVTTSSSELVAPQGPNTEKYAERKEIGRNSRTVSQNQKNLLVGSLPQRLCGAFAIDVRLFRSALLDNCGSRHPVPAACQPGSPWEGSDMKDGEIADQTFDQTPSLMCVLYLSPKTEQAHRPNARKRACGMEHP